MRRFSPKRRKRISEVAPFREAFKLEVGRCELCGKRRGLVIHEIARGQADRQKALDKRYAILVLCDPGCHQKMDRLSRAHQLCLLYCRRPYDFDLNAYQILTCRRYPDLGDVMDLVETVMEEME
jgi:hypothetical protein